MNGFESFNIDFNNRFGSLKLKRILCAVSGGADSMVMLDLLRRLDLNIGVAHCNFKLRAGESDLDEQLVKKYCAQHQIQFHSVSFDTLNISQEQKTGIQETARTLRYNWFHSLLEEFDYNIIATAHHANDNAETILFNLVRGTGITGASGIPELTTRLFRPLLQYQKSSIMQFAEQENIPFRNDSSNASTKYARNKIRHKIFPLLSEINHNAIEHINAFGQQSAVLNDLLKERITALQNECIQVQGDNSHLIKLEPILAQKHTVFWLYELLKTYGFNKSHTEDILSANQSGAVFISHSHRIIKNRKELILQEHSKTDASLKYELYLNSLPDSIEYHSQKIYFEKKTAAQIHAFEKDILYLDADLLNSSVIVRNWIAGDKFQPLGMKSKKKVSDFLIDRKISRSEKEKILVLESNNEIMAIIGMQISNKVRLTNSSKTILQVSIKHKGGLI